MSQKSEEHGLQESGFDESVIWCLQVRLLKTHLLVCKQVLARPRMISFSTKVEAGVCDIQYIFWDSMVTVSVVVMMGDLILSSRLYHQITHAG